MQQPPYKLHAGAQRQSHSQALRAPPRQVYRSIYERCCPTGACSVSGATCTVWWDRQGLASVRHRTAAAGAVTLHPLQPLHPSL